MVDLTRQPSKGASRPLASPTGERRHGIDRVISLLETLLRQRAPTRVAAIACLVNALRSTAYEIVNRLIEADILENVGP
ncbi:helix-turn-helix domain-containing protein [Microvirga sp. M2]|uniref:helix-turn-helix domain-containing protein n=1 Tax=Microvirga sp. M2 TaxID=3073270 RepID=UPI0039C029AC